VDGLCEVLVSALPLVALMGLEAQKEAFRSASRKLWAVRLWAVLWVLLRRFSRPPVALLTTPWGMFRLAPRMLWSGWAEDRLVGSAKRSTFPTLLL
jgi:hypothetical protein